MAITCQDCGTEMLTETCPKCGGIRSKAEARAELQTEKPPKRASPLIPIGGLLAVGGGILLFSGLAGSYGAVPPVVSIAGIVTIVVGGAMVGGGVLRD